MRPPLAAIGTRKVSVPLAASHAPRQAALLRAQGNMGQAAALLKMDRSNIYRLVKRLGITISAGEDHDG